MSQADGKDQPRRAAGHAVYLMQINAAFRWRRYSGGMFWLMLVLHLFVGATLAGVGLVVALVAGLDSFWMLGGAVLAGFVVAGPVSWIVARRLHFRQ